MEKSHVEKDYITGQLAVSHYELTGEVYRTACGRLGVVIGPSRIYGESEVVVAVPLQPGERPRLSSQVVERNGRRYESLAVAASQVVRQLRARKRARGEPLGLPRPGLNRAHVRPSRKRVERELYLASSAPAR
jgi:hypothetical protein